MESHASSALQGSTSWLFAAGAGQAAAAAARLLLLEQASWRANCWALLLPLLGA